MKGLASVLDQFSKGLRARKVLPSLLADLLSFNIAKVLSRLQMKDPHLLPSILPNVFAISTNLSPPQFALQVLPSLKPLFAVKEPPQNMMALLNRCMGGAIMQSFGSTSCRLCTACQIRRPGDNDPPSGR